MYGIVELRAYMEGSVLMIYVKHFNPTTNSIETLTVPANIINDNLGKEIDALANNILRAYKKVGG
ncbi:MAG TPA: hypothetical protein VFC79_00220 [Tissierellaceae bacterium]|nr:hypothetical protein [Tissierellaceae bacterium]